MRSFLSRSLYSAVAFLSVSVSSFASSQDQTNYSTIVDEPVRYSHSDFGGVGLLQVPTARMAPDGNFSVNFSHVSPYNRTSISAQLLPWLEGTVRYTAITNRKYSESIEFSGNQSYKDRGFDIKVRLWEESEWLPDFSVAFHDFAGTGLFSSEYMLMSKRYYNWDFTLGLAWGNGGAAGGIKNPFRLLGDRFETRDEFEGQGGDVNFGNYFSGEEVAPVAGVEYSSWGSDWAFKVELDGNDYKSEGLNNRFSQEYPINVGVVYRVNDLFKVQVGWERGDTAMAGIQLGLNFGSNDSLMPKFDEPIDPYQPIHKEDQLTNVDAENMVKALNAQKIKVQQISVNDEEARVVYRQNKFRNHAQALGRASRVLANYLPATIGSYQFIEQSGSLPVSSTRIDSQSVRQHAEGKISGNEVLATAQITEVESLSKLDDKLDDTQAINEQVVSAPNWDWRIRPIFTPSFGAPESFVIYKLWLKFAVDFQFTDNFSMENVFAVNLHNNYDKLDEPSDSVLPHVRSDVKEYAKEGENGIVRMQMDYLWKPSHDIYARLSSGLFETMFGGVGGEVLYKPVHSRLAIGADLNYVKQRDYDQLFTFRDYTVATGHLTFYYDTPIKNVLAKVSAGRYLAKDKGVTLDLSRTFDTGVVLGGWATKTNVSSEDFGEGSFDKGIYIKFPLDLFFVESRKDSLTASWRPLTRDGGQKLITGRALYDFVGANDKETLSKGWNAFGE